MSNHHQFVSISDAHRAFGLPKPLHPLISLLNQNEDPVQLNTFPDTHVLTFYKISYKPKLSGKVRYGQDYYDFDEGGLLFAAPNQIIGGLEDDASNSIPCSSHTLLIHPDFLWNHPLAKKIRQYGFFYYTTNEALHLSESERDTIISVFEMIGNELKGRIDDFSQQIIISQIELLLNYAERFYRRQFITRKSVSNELMQKLDDVVADYFDKEVTTNQGLPTVNYIAEQMNLSPSYLSDMLRSLIGLNAQQYLHSKLIDKAKEKLSTTNLSVSEVAFALGFEHSQSFSKLFKTKTNLSPLEFRRSFN
ncbi:AraC family transcriptional regulator [Dyadobacter luteus]|uniref:AraC family transcriptional regulator n=1 Tax=Dyadobacter luteus TaxID=2259619 RepID=A0A3D8YAY8_9BACT|nr:response regulator transcription factor [Dyadobacter luteus]REA60970.1 AraC family transcriptional regulator [Dyadobacter luteus]